MSGDLFPTIYPRNVADTSPITPPNIDYRVDRYSAAVLGGPDRCTITATGGREDLFELIEVLRCPIDIRHKYLDLVWWGFVSKVVINAGSLAVGVDLGNMANRVAVAYSYIEPGTQTVGVRKTTAFSTDADSIAEFGTKDLLLSIGGATAAQATQIRDRVLTQNRYPIAYWQTAAGGKADTITATIECRGWWSSLDWRSYANTGSGTIETTAQIATMIASVGQFIAGTSIETASGITGNEYRDGDSTARAEIEDLLTMGTTAGLRLAATVTPERVARIFGEPVARAADYWIDKDGKLFDPYMNPIDNAACPVGVWISLFGVIPTSADISRMSNPASAFVDSAEYDAQRGTYTPTPRGVPSPFEVARVVVGW